MRTNARNAANIRIDGVRETVAALKAFTPEVEAQLDYEIKEALERVHTATQANYPKGAWVVGRSRKRLLGYIAARAGGGKSTKSWGKGPAGRRAAIFEFIGSQYAGTRPQVLGLIASLNERYGQPGRFLWAAWEQIGARVLEDIEAAVKGAEAALQAQLDAAGETY